MLVTERVTKKERTRLQLGPLFGAALDEICKVSHPFKWCFFSVSSVSSFAVTIWRQVLDPGAL